MYRFWHQNPTYIGRTSPIHSTWEVPPHSGFQHNFFKDIRCLENVFGIWSFLSPSCSQRISFRRPCLSMVFIKSWFKFRGRLSFSHDFLSKMSPQEKTFLMPLTFSTFGQICSFNLKGRSGNSFTCGTLLSKSKNTLLESHSQEYFYRTKG